MVRGERALGPAAQRLLPPHQPQDLQLPQVQVAGAGQRSFPADPTEQGQDFKAGGLRFARARNFRRTFFPERNFKSEVKQSN